MSVQLQKGQKVSLVKENVGLSKIIVGLGWDEAAGYADTIDCDAFAILTSNGRVTSNADVVYFNNLEHSSHAVKHMGDNLTGAGEGDDEQIVIDLNLVPAQYDRIIICVNIYDARKKNQHFGMIDNAFIRVVDGRNNRELCIYNLSENYSGMTAMIFGEVYRKDGDWKFNAIGQGTTDGWIAEVAARYGYVAQSSNTSSASSSSTSSSSGGCYVATAVYGSYDCPEVWTLRRYRDYTLAQTWYGRAFIRTYYAVSPTIVKWFGKTEWFKKMWRGKLDRMVKNLNSEGVENTPYEDRNW